MSSCCCPYECECSRALIALPATTTTTTLCPDAIICEGAVLMDCVAYSSCYELCSQTKTGDSLVKILGTLFEMTGLCIPPTSTTTTTTIGPQAFKCEDCTFVFDVATQNNISLLNVGNLISGPCTEMQNYAIDWYLDDTSSPIQFTSGNSTNTDPDIVQFHPFTGNNARPSVAGNWIPVIRYVYIAGVKYTSSYEYGPGRIYSPDLASCLEPIVIENLNCSNGAFDPAVFNYSHRLQYSAVIQNPSDSTRTFNFDLDSLTNFFAWTFSGYLISDKLEFYYISGATETSLGKYAIGTDVPAIDFTGTIKKIAQQEFKDVFDLSAFTFIAGDYIRIDVTSSFADPTNQDTNWFFQCVCLEEFDCTLPPSPVIDPCSSVMTFDSLACRYELTYNYLSYSDTSTSDTYKYLTNEIPLRDGGELLHAPSNSEPYTTFSFVNGEFCNINSFPPGSCTNASLKTLTKVGSVYTIDFTNEAEYLFWKNDYTNLYNTLNLTYSSDTSNVNHFKYFYYQYLNDPSLTGCGDNFVRTYIYFHFTSPVTFDDVNYIMEIDVRNTTNTMPPRCNNSCILIATSLVNSTIIATDFGPLSSTVRPGYQGTITYTVSNNVVDYAGYGLQSQHLLPYGFSNYVCNQEPSLCIRTLPLYTELRSIFFYDYVTITDLEDGENNYRIESRVGPDGCLALVPTIIYEIANGIVTTPSAGCP